MNEVKVCSLKNEEMQKNNSELFYVLRKLALESRVVFKAELLTMFPHNYKRGINECAKRPENVLKILQELNKRLPKRVYCASRQD